MTDYGVIEIAMRPKTLTVNGVWTGSGRSEGAV